MVISDRSHPLPISLTCVKEFLKIYLAKCIKIYEVHKNLKNNFLKNKKISKKLPMTVIAKFKQFP